MLFCLFLVDSRRRDMGDEMDFIEWAATVEMLADAEKRLNLLSLAQ